MAREIRRQNLHNYLSSFSEKPSTLMLGEAPGWRGCRFTGVPFTSENIQIQKTLPFEGCPTSQGEQPYAEASATIFWRVMRKYHPSFFIWNCLPLHPHQPGNPLSNRRPGTTELRCHFALLEEMIGILSPIRVIAVGRCAQKALKELEIPCLHVRHPSHGGAREFQDGLERIMSADREDNRAD